MTEIIPWLLSALAIMLAVVPLPGLAQWRMAAALLALGAGQIYIAVVSLVLLLLVDNHWRVPFRQGTGATLALLVLLAGIVLLTVSQETDLRSWSELTQLGLYVGLFLLFSARLRDGRDVQSLLQAAILASVGVASLALLAIPLGWVSAPDIFFVRGQNEASIYLALLGVVPCAVMFTRTRRLHFLAACAPMLLAQQLATSRGSLAVSLIVLMVAGFLWSRSLVLRGLMVIGGLVVLATNVPQLKVIYDAQINTSARERLALLDYAGGLMDERFWTGWGWGSTSRLASAAPNTSQAYPHFHNAYVQMVVELGVLGWVIIGLAAWLAVRWLTVASFTIRQPGVTALVACSVLGIGTACLFDAMMFGADRSIQLIILLALCSRSLALAKAAVPALPPRNKAESLLFQTQSLAA